MSYTAFRVIKNSVSDLESIPLFSEFRNCCDKGKLDFDDHLVNSWFHWGRILPSQVALKDETVY